MMNSNSKKERMMAWSCTVGLPEFFAKQNGMLITEYGECYQEVPGAIRAIDLYNEPVTASSSAREDVARLKAAAQQKQRVHANALRSITVGSGETIAKKKRTKRLTGRGGRGIGLQPKKSDDESAYSPPLSSGPARSERLAELKAQKMEQKEQATVRAGIEAAVKTAKLDADTPANLERALKFVERKAHYSSLSVRAGRIDRCSAPCCSRSHPAMLVGALRLAT